MRYSHRLATAKARLRSARAQLIRTGHKNLAVEIDALIEKVETVIKIAAAFDELEGA